MSRPLVLLAGLMLAATMLSGCVIEPGYYHHGWWHWHHDHDR